MIFGPIAGFAFNGLLYDCAKLALHHKMQNYGPVFQRSALLLILDAEGVNEG